MKGNCPYLPTQLFKYMRVLRYIQNERQNGTGPGIRVVHRDTFKKTYKALALHITLKSFKQL